MLNAIHPTGKRKGVLVVVALSLALLGIFASVEFG